MSEDECVVYIVISGCTWGKFLSWKSRPRSSQTSGGAGLERIRPYVIYRDSALRGVCILHRECVRCSSPFPHPNSYWYQATYKIRVQNETNEREGKAKTSNGRMSYSVYTFRPFLDRSGPGVHQLTCKLQMLPIISMIHRMFKSNGSLAQWRRQRWWWWWEWWLWLLLSAPFPPPLFYFGKVVRNLLPASGSELTD